MPELACPLCRDSASMKRPRTLYGHIVCTRCWSSFVSRRQFAWIIDVLLIQFGVGFLVGFVAAVLRVKFEGVSGWLIYAAVCVAVVFKDGFQGHSLGKRICGVQVVDAEHEDGEKMTTTYRVSSDRQSLYVTTKVEPAEGDDLTVRLVYDAAKASGTPVQ